MNGELEGWTGGGGWSFVVGRPRWGIEEETDGSSLGPSEPPLGPPRCVFSAVRGISFGAEIVFAKGGEGFGDSIGGDGRRSEAATSLIASGAGVWVRGKVGAGGDGPGLEVSSPDGGITRLRCCSFFSCRAAFAAFLRAVLESLEGASLSV